MPTRADDGIILCADDDRCGGPIHDRDMEESTIYLDHSTDIDILDEVQIVTIEHLFCAESRVYHDLELLSLLV